jgi:membrane dipeptidase
MDLNKHLVWDNHVYVSPVPGTATIEGLERHLRAGFDVAFLNLGDSDYPLEHVLRMAAFARRWINENEDRFVLLNDVSDIERARREGKLAVGFNIEGSYCVGDQLDTVSLLYDLGVRWMLFVYNRQNLAGYGVHDDEDKGLSDFGRKLAAEMDRVGMIKCCTHTGYRTAMDILEASDKPCIFSHSNARALKDHARNIPDDLIRACAETNGVIGVNGINIFLGNGGPDPQLMVEHIDYIAQLVGVDHVGLGFDHGYMDLAELNDVLAGGSDFWPAGNEYDKEIDCVPAEGIGAIIEGLEGKGYREADIAGVLGENMLRVARAVWR